VTPAETELQQRLRALRDVVADARDALSEESFRVFVDLMAELVAREAARCVNWEQLRRWAA